MLARKVPSSQKAASWFEYHPVITIVTLLVVLIFMLDVVLATSYALINGYPFAEMQDRKLRQMKAVSEIVEKTYRIPSQEFHHTLASLQAFDNVMWGPIVHSIRTNSLGFKDKETRHISLVPQHRRIVFMGDSFTEGVGVNYNDTFVGVIDKALSPRNIEILNAGVSSYSPLIYWRKTRWLLQDVGLKFHELIVFLDISDVEDEGIYYAIDENGVIFRKTTMHDRDEKPAEALSARESLLKNLLKNHSMILYTLYGRMRDVFTDQYSYYVNARRSMWTIDKNVYEEFGDVGIQRMKVYMDNLLNLTRENSIKLAVAVYPWPDQIMRNDLNSLHVNIWKSWCDENKVEFFNFFPDFITGKTLEERKAMIKTHFISGDSHWNANGHERIAKLFLARFTPTQEEQLAHHGSDVQH